MAISNVREEGRLEVRERERDRERLDARSGIKSDRDKVEKQRRWVAYWSTKKRERLTEIEIEFFVFVFCFCRLRVEIKSSAT